MKRQHSFMNRHIFIYKYLAQLKVQVCLDGHDQESYADANAITPEISVMS